MKSTFNCMPPLNEPEQIQPHTKLFFARTELFIPLEMPYETGQSAEGSALAHSESRHSNTQDGEMENLWLRINESIAKERSSYFFPSISAFLYKHAKWWKRDFHETYRLFFGSYGNEPSTKNVEITIHHAMIVEFPFQSFLLLQIDLPLVWIDAAEANNWLSYLYVSYGIQPHIQSMQNGVCMPLCQLFERIAKSAHRKISKQTAKVFVYSMFGVDDEVKLDPMHPLMVTARDFRIDYEDEFYENAYDERSVLQRWKSRISSFSFNGGLTVALGINHYNRNFLPYYTFSIYRDIAILGLYQLYALNSLSLELSCVEDLLKNRKKIQETRKQILQFTNQSWFSQISSGQNAQILWDYWQKNLGIIQLYQEVVTQLEQLNNYVYNANNRKFTIAVGTLTFLAWPLSVLSSLYTIGIRQVFWAFLLLPAFVLFLAGLWWGLSYYMKHHE